MYLTLPSNTKDYTQANNTHSFRVQLPEPISLEGRWEVALVDIQYPYSWKNVVGEHFVAMHYRLKSGLGGVTLYGKIPEGHYSDVAALIGAIKVGIREAARKAPEVEASANLMTYRSQLKIKYRVNVQLSLRQDLPSSLVELLTDEELEHDTELYDILVQAKQNKEPTQEVAEMEQALSYSFVKETNQLQLHLEEGKSINTLVLPGSFKYMLGLESSSLPVGTTAARYSPDLTGGLTTLYVHCNIVEPQVVGNYRSELLRTVPVDSRKRFGDTVHKLFNSPHYINVLHKNFDNIKIEIRSDTGEPIPFEYGKVIVKLHFRKSKGW